MTRWLLHTTQRIERTYEVDAASENEAWERHYADPPQSVKCGEIDSGEDEILAMEKKI